MRSRCFLLSLLLCTCLLGCSGGQPDATEAGSTAAPAQTTEAPAVPQTAGPEEVSCVTAQPTEPVVLLHSGIREDGSFDGGVLFIGDSLTCGFVDHLQENGLIGDARYMAIPGIPVTAYFDGPVIQSSERNYAAGFEEKYSDGFEGLYFSEAVEQVGESVTAVYVMLGTNYSEHAGPDAYIRIVDHLLESCPGATVYLQLVPYARLARIPYEQINGQVTEAFSHYQTDRDPRVQLIDTHSAIGYNLLPDGVHLTNTGEAQWYQALMDFARSSGIPQ